MKNYTDQGAEYTIDNDNNPSMSNDTSVNKEPIKFNWKPMFPGRDWGPEYTHEAVEARFHERGKWAQRENEFYSDLWTRNGGRYTRYTFRDFLTSLFNPAHRDQLERLEAMAKQDADNARWEAARYNYINKCEDQVNDILAGKHVENPEPTAYVSAQILRVFR